MRRFTLFLAAALVAVLSFAQVPRAEKAMPAMLNKTSVVENRHAVVKQLDVKALPKNAKALPVKAVSKKAQLKVSNNLQNTALKAQAKKISGKQFDRDRFAKMQKLSDAGKVKPASKNVAKVARKKIGGTDLVTPPFMVIRDAKTYKVTCFSYMDYAETRFDVKVGKSGNTMYIQGLFRNCPDAWIKGTIADDGASVTFAKDQYMGESEVFDLYSGESMGVFPAWLEYTEDFETYCDFTMTISAEGIMDDAKEGLCAFAMDDELNAIDALRFIRLTPEELLADVSYDLVTPPAGKEMKAVNISALSLARKSQTSTVGMMIVDGNDIYVQGLCIDMPAAWVKGTINGGKATFAKGQYLGTYNGMYDMWIMGVNPDDESATPELKDAVALWNAEESTLEFMDDQAIVENADAKSLYYLDVLLDEIVEPLPEGLSIAVPPAGLETKTYKTSVYSLGDYSYAQSSYPVQIGFDGNDAYMQGLFYFSPTSWIKGTRNEDGSITFPKNQYLGTVQGYDVFVVPCDDDETILDSFTFRYADDTYFYNAVNENISFSVAPDTTDALEIIYNVVMKGPDAPAVHFDVISEQPAGEVKTYARNGGAYYSFWGYLIPTTQSGTSIEVTFAEDGKTVYMKDPISQAMIEGGAWVKGTIEGNKIHMPVGQCILFSDEEEYGYMTAVCKAEKAYDEEYEEYYTNYFMDDTEEITFTIDDETGVITMDMVSEVDEEGYADKILGLVYTDDLAWAAYGDYNSVYTPFNETLTLIPETAEKQTWAFMYTTDNSSSADIVNVAFEGDKVYVAGLNPEIPEAAIVGTVDGDKVTFASDQFLGISYGFFSYAVFANQVVELVWDDYYEEYMEMAGFEYLPSFTFTYDKEKKVITSEGDVAFVLNAGKGAEEMLYIYYGAHPKFSYFEDKAVKPADPEVLALDNFFDDYGYDILALNVKLEDVNGNYIDKDKVSYIVYVKIDGEVEPFTFFVDEYPGLAEHNLDEITEIPYTMEVFDDYGYQDIAIGGSNVCIYQTGFDDYGAQTVYYGGNERNESDIVWLHDDSDATAIKNVVASDSKASIFDLSGRQLKKLQKGINIIKTQSGKTVKINLK